MNILITCPPMLRSIEAFRLRFKELNFEIVTPTVVQTLSEDELLALVPEVDGWIIGDDPATARVFEAGRRGRLRAAVKWGVGVDNVDFDACGRLGIRIGNTPGMFGREVADLAYSYIVALARQSFFIDSGVKTGLWPKPAGMSLAGKTVALVGLGDIGRQLAKRLLVAEMNVIGYDPAFDSIALPDGVVKGSWPKRLEEADFLVLTCALNPATRHLLNATTLRIAREGVRVVNVARGALIDEAALIDALQSGRVHSAALEVFDIEPLPNLSRLRAFADRCVFGSHNASNTIEAVARTSYQALELLHQFLSEEPALCHGQT